MSATATAVVAMDKLVHVSRGDDKEIEVLEYHQLYKQRMAFLCLRRTVVLHPINPDDNDALLMDILFAWRCAAHSMPIPKAFAVECLQERVAEQYRQYA